ALNKTLADSVTKEELAGYTGALDCPPGELSDLTGIGYMTGLTSLSCSKNNVTKIPSEIKNLVNLETLDFGKAYSVESIPKEIGSLEKLKYMRFYLTSITALPKELCNLQNLKFLILGANQIQSVPEELGNLSKLQYLDIHDNQLTTIPDSICSLTDLRELDLSHNSLTALPSNFGRLVKLKTLNLFNNKIRILPKSMENMLNLDTLNVYDNYELSESYKSFMPKMQSSRTDILSGSDCILTLPPGLDPNNEKITFEFKNDDTAFDVYYDYTKIKPSAPEPGKITLRKGLFTGSGPYVFRITVKKPGESPAYDIYLWHINVQ
ncbi:MAG: leucine-rich repeat domain-containing protein, partial [Bacillota bacterium]|nr:leucine-rich repeat domain-containing protein [Bacillota bacterium]